MFIQHRYTSKTFSAINHMLQKICLETVSTGPGVYCKIMLIMHAILLLVV